MAEIQPRFLNLEFSGHFGSESGGFHAGFGSKTNKNIRIGPD